MKTEYHHYYSVFWQCVMVRLRPHAASKTTNSFDSKHTVIQTYSLLVKGRHDMFSPIEWRSTQCEHHCSMLWQQMSVRLRNAWNMHNSFESHWTKINADRASPLLYYIWTANEGEIATSHRLEHQWQVRNQARSNASVRSVCQGPARCRSINCTKTKVAIVWCDATQQGN